MDREKYRISVSTSARNLLLALCIFCIAHISVRAAQDGLNSGALFTSGLAIVNVVAIDYGVIEVSGGANNDITIDPANGNITCTNNADYDCPATGTRGSFQIAGTPGLPVDLSCQRNGDISNGIDTYRFNQGRIHVGSTTHLCSGRQTVVTSHIIAGNSTDDTVYVGARLRVRNGSFSLGQYTTVSPLTIRAVYQ